MYAVCSQYSGTFVMSNEDGFPPPCHDHSVCTKDALLSAENNCKHNNVRFTRMRRRVFEIIWENHEPVGAYDILARLNENGGRTAPIAVYRALDFLLKQDLIHRIQSMNAFVGCSEPQRIHKPHFLICSSCKAAAEIPNSSIHQSVSLTAEANGFKIVDSMLEIRGTCSNCQSLEHKHV